MASQQQISKLCLVYHLLCFQTGSLLWGWIYTNWNLCCLCCGWWKVSLISSLVWNFTALPVRFIQGLFLIVFVKQFRIRKLLAHWINGVGWFWRSLIANLSAANCYKSEHLKRPENWALGTFSTFTLLICFLMSSNKYLFADIVFSF